MRGHLFFSCSGWIFFLGGGAVMTPVSWRTVETANETQRQFIAFSLPVQIVRNERIDPTFERVGLSRAAQCFSPAVAMAADHTTNGILPTAPTTEKHAALPR